MKSALFALFNRSARKGFCDEKRGFDRKKTGVFGQGIYR